MSKFPPPLNEPAIDEHLNVLIRKDKSLREIAQWFAIWGYEQGKASVPVPQLAEVSEQ